MLHSHTMLQNYVHFGISCSFKQFYPELTYPLNELLGNKPWKWSKAYERSFVKLKEVVTSGTVLIHYDPAKK